MLFSTVERGEKYTQVDYYAALEEKENNTYREREIDRQKLSTVYVSRETDTTVATTVDCISVLSLSDVTAPLATGLTRTAKRSSPSSIMHRTSTKNTETP